MRIFGYNITVARDLAGQGAPTPKWVPTHRHRKGGQYRCVLEGQLESDLTPVVIYDDQKGQVWVRPHAEFYDGRFTALAG